MSENQYFLQITTNLRISKFSMLQRILSFIQNGRLSSAIRLSPPPLMADYDLAAYREFMCQETHLYTADYIRQRVQINGAQHFEAALQRGSVIVVFVHHGSWLLMNGALHHMCGGAPITSIASRRNLEFCTPEEKAFWLGVHRRSAESCNAPVIFYTDQSPIGPVRWLKSPHHVLTVALDVREPAANKPEQAFQFMGQTIYLQTGPARLAQMTGAQMVPAAIEYNPQTQCHSLSLYPALNPAEWTAQELTQKALDDIGPHIARSPQQQFYDLLGALQVPQAA
jgi:hypothetical protein